MDLSPADVRMHDFDRVFWGYRPDEVKAFLQQLSIQWERQLGEHRQLEERVGELEAKVAHYRQVEEALQEAVRTARESKEEALRHAEREAALIVKEAEAKAEEIKRDAREEHHRLKQETSQIGGRRQEIVARLRAFLMSEMELLAYFEGDDPVGYIKMLPPERRRQLQAVAEASDEEEVGQDEAQASLSTPPTVPPVEPAEDDDASKQAGEEERTSATAASTGERSGLGWTMHPLFSASDVPTETSEDSSSEEADAPFASGDEEPVAASSAELERIRRVLDDVG